MKTSKLQVALSIISIVPIVSLILQLISPGFVNSCQLILSIINIFCVFVIFIYSIFTIKSRNKKSVWQKFIYTMTMLYIIIIVAIALIVIINNTSN